MSLSVQELNNVGNIHEIYLDIGKISVSSSISIRFIQDSGCLMTLKYLFKKNFMKRKN